MSKALWRGIHAAGDPDRCGHAELAVCASSARRGGATWTTDPFSWQAIPTYGGGEGEANVTLAAIATTPAHVCVLPPPAVGLVIAGKDGPIGAYIDARDAEKVRRAAEERRIHLWHKKKREPTWAETADQEAAQTARALAHIFSRKLARMEDRFPEGAGPGYNPATGRTEIVDVWVDASVDQSLR